MYSKPQELDNSSDPLNPTVNYTHFHPSPEQQDPHVPLGFKIYGIGCLTAFLIFLLLVVVYVAFTQVRRFRKGQEETGKGRLRNLGKPSLPDALEDGLEKTHVATERATLSPRPPACSSSSYEGENVRWRGKTRDMGSWDSSVTMVDAESPRIPPASHFNGPSPRTHSPVFCNVLAPTPNATPIPASVPRLDTPVSPKTMSISSNYASPVEPRKAMLANFAHRAIESPRRSVKPKVDDLNLEMSESQSSPLMVSGRNPGSSPKGILKTSPTYVARNPSKALSHASSSSDSVTSISTGDERKNAHSSHSLGPSSAPVRYHSRNPASSRPTSDETFLSGSRVQNTRDFATEFGRPHYSSNNSSSPRPSGILSITPSPTLESHIIHLGPDPKQSLNGQSGTPRRVSISVPRNSISFVPSTKSDAATATSQPRYGRNCDYQPEEKLKEQSHIVNYSYNRQ